MNPKAMYEKLIEKVKKEKQVCLQSYYRTGEYLHIIITNELYKVKYTTIHEFARVELKTSAKTLENQVRVYRYLSKLSEKTRNFILETLAQSQLLYVVYLLEFGGDEFYDEEKLKKIVEEWKKKSLRQTVAHCKKLLGDKYPKPVNPKRKKIDVVKIPAEEYEKLTKELQKLKEELKGTVHLAEYMVVKNQLKHAEAELKKLKEENLQLQRELSAYKRKYAGAKSMMVQYKKEAESCRVAISLIEEKTSKNLLQKIRSVIGA